MELTKKEKVIIYPLILIVVAIAGFAGNTYISDTEANFTVPNFTVTSDNFNVDKDGNINMSGSVISQNDSWCNSTSCKNLSDLTDSFITSVNNWFEVSGGALVFNETKGGENYINRTGDNVTGNFIISGNLTADYVEAQPTTGAISSGIIASLDNIDLCGCLNVTKQGGNSVKVPASTTRLVAFDGTITYCENAEITLTGIKDGHKTFYNDNTCDLLNTSFGTFFESNILPSDHARICDVYTHGGEVEDVKGATMLYLAKAKEDQLSVNCGGGGHLSVCTGMDVTEDTFPSINLSSGSFRYVGTQVPTDAKGSKANGIHLVSKMGGVWVHRNASGINFTGCNDGTDYIDCPTDVYRQYVVYDLGWTANALLHQLAPLSSATFANIGACIDDASNGIDYTLPDDEQGIGVVLGVYCAKRDAAAWGSAVSWTPLKKSVTGGGSADLTPYAIYAGWTQNSDADNKNLTNVGNIQSNSGLQVGSGASQINITLTSPDTNEWCCGVNDTGAFSCSAGACP